MGVALDAPVVTAGDANSGGMESESVKAAIGSTASNTHCRAQRRIGSGLELRGGRRECSSTARALLCTLASCS